MKTQRKFLFSTMAAAMLGAAAVPTTALADGAGAFVGGMMAARVMSNMNERTEAEQEQAYYAEQSAQRPVQQAAPAQQSAEQRIQELDKLAAGGYITPEEYKQKKQAIIDGM